MAVPSPTGDAPRRAAEAAIGLDAFSCSHYASFVAAATSGARAFSPLRHARDLERAAQADVLRDVVGRLPFPLVEIDPAWLAWHRGATVQLAAAVYEERQLPSGHLDAALLAVLADMLEEAGCCDGDLLGHLRSPGPHVRGCWAVDLLTGRE
jgi:hypothetical protein